MARVTGLEPATSGVTGRHSNQLSYTRAVGRRFITGSGQTLQAKKTDPVIFLIPRRSNHEISQRFQILKGIR